MQPLGAALAAARATLTSCGIATAALDARLLLQHVLGVSHEWLTIHTDAPLSEAQHAQFHALIAKRTQHVPVAHLLGARAFWKHDFMVSADTLIPRPDSETIIEAILKLFPDRSAPLRMLDLGLGSGCLPFSALSEYPNASGVGVDISDAALQVAEKNCQALSLQKRVKLYHGSWCDALPEGAMFDVVISNPPYIPSANLETLDDEVKRHEPHLALDGGDDGLKMYCRILECLPKHMHLASVVVFEVGDGQARDVMSLAETLGF